MSVRRDRLRIFEIVKSQVATTPAQLYDIPHGGDCCERLQKITRDQGADIVCNECGAVVMRVSAAKIRTALRELDTTEGICSAVCPHCAVPNVFPGLSTINGYVCRECGEDVSVEPSVQ
jgi:hypothetical protein